MIFFFDSSSSQLLVVLLFPFVRLPENKIGQYHNNPINLLGLYCLAIVFNIFQSMCNAHAIIKLKKSGSIVLFLSI